MVQDDALLDDIIDRLLDVRTGRPGKQVALSETEVRQWMGVHRATAHAHACLPTAAEQSPPARLPCLRTCPYQLPPMQIRQLCLTAKEIFMSQPNLLELEAPIKICGEASVAIRRSGRRLAHTYALNQHAAGRFQAQASRQCSLFAG